MSEQPTEHEPQSMPEHGAASGQSATERAEELLDQWGRRTRLFMAAARQQVENTIASARTSGTHGNGQQGASTEQAGTPTGEAPAEGARPSPQPAPERAEALLDEWGQRIGRSTALAGQQLRKMAARAREEAEDILAEARHIRDHDGEKSGQA